MPSYLFLDRDGNQLGVLRSETDWQIGAVVERTSGRYRMLEVVVPIMDDIDGMVAYVIVEPAMHCQTAERPERRFVIRLPSAPSTPATVTASSIVGDAVFPKPPLEPPSSESARPGRPSTRSEL